MTALQKGLVLMAIVFLAGNFSTRVDWTSKPVITFVMGALAVILLVGASAIAHAKSDGESDGG